MYYKMGFSKIQHQLWHGKTAGVRTENRFFVSHAARTGTLPHGIPALGGSQVRGFPHQVPLVMQRWSQAPKKCMAMHHKLPKTLMCNPMSHRGQFLHSVKDYLVSKHFPPQNISHFSTRSLLKSGPSFYLQHLPQILKMCSIFLKLTSEQKHYFSHMFFIPSSTSKTPLKGSHHWEL